MPSPVIEGGQGGRGGGLVGGAGGAGLREEDGGRRTAATQILIRSQHDGTCGA
jgi:hypothetical protein